MWSRWRCVRQMLIFCGPVLGELEAEGANASARVEDHA